MDAYTSPKIIEPSPKTHLFYNDAIVVCPHNTCGFQPRISRASDMYGPGKPYIACRECDFFAWVDNSSGDFKFVKYADNNRNNPPRELELYESRKLMAKLGGRSSDAPSTKRAKKSQDDEQFKRVYDMLVNVNARLTGIESHLSAIQATLPSGPEF